MFAERILRLAEQIRSLFSRGLEISAESRQYIDATFSCPKAAQVAAICADRASCERDSLIELLLFPDRRMQMELEDTLDRWQYNSADPAALIDCLSRRPLHVRFYFPDGRGGFHLQVPPEALGSFVVRLHITRRLAPSLAHTLAASLDQDLQTAVKVRLRNAGVGEMPPAVAFLNRFFKGFDQRSADFFSCLDFTLEFLAEKHATPNIFDALAARKHLFFKMLRQADALDRQLRRHNMETMVLQGARICQADRGQIVRRIAQIDTVCLAVYGQTAMAAPGPQPVTLALSPGNPDDLGTIGRLLD